MSVTSLLNVNTTEIAESISSSVAERNRMSVSQFLNPKGEGYVYGYVSEANMVQSCIIHAVDTRSCVPFVDIGKFPCLYHLT